MAYIHPALEAYQRKRFMRPDAKRWLREDVGRYFKSKRFSAEERKVGSGQPQSITTGDGDGRTAVQLIADLHRARFEVLSLRSALIGFRLQRLLRKALPPNGGVIAEGPLHYLMQPRVPWGNPDGGRWTRVAGGGARGRGLVGNLPGHSLGAEARLASAMARTERALDQIRQFEPDWKPRAPSITDPGKLDGAVAEAEARAIEAEMHLSRLRSGMGGNFGPPLEPAVPLSARAASFDAEGWIGAYRTIYNAPDLFGRPSWPSDSGTVAVARIDGKVTFGVNSNAPGYTSIDAQMAQSMRSTLLEKYPSILDLSNIGAAPNDSMFHAEATILLRAAKELGGSLADRTFEVNVDREVRAASCQYVLPKLGAELGNPAITFVSRGGVRNTMWNGEWLGGFKR